MGDIMGDIYKGIYNIYILDMGDILDNPQTSHILWLFNIAMENDPFIDDVPI